MDWKPDEEITDHDIIEAARYLNDASIPMRGRQYLDEDGIAHDIPDDEEGKDDSSTTNPQPEV